MKKNLPVLCLFFYLLNPLAADANENSDLHGVILSRDSVLFDVGFNECEVDKIENLLSDDFEFLHDKDGTSDKNEFLDGLRNGLCASPSTYRSRRELVSDSTEIYPLYSKEKLYAVIQNGDHRFYESINGKAEKLVGAAKFTNVWFLVEDEWKIKRSLSFDHQALSVIESRLPLSKGDAAIEKWLLENKVPTLGLGVIRDGRLQQVKVFGILKNEASAPYNTIFNVASLTKPITAIVALKLISQGKWSLDDPVGNYWVDPDIVNDPRAMLITTRHILSHQTGFPNWRGVGDDQKLNFEFDPGKGYQYSGEGFEYLRRALEQKFGKSLDTLAKELIFRPLKMNDTEFFWSDKTDGQRYADNYSIDGSIYGKVENTKANAADDVLTTVQDYGNFLVSVMSGEVLSNDVFKDMITPQVDVKNNKHFGLGFLIYNLENGKLGLSHGGGDNGVQTLVAYVPETQQGLIIFTNVDDGYKVYRDLLVHYLGDDGKRIYEVETGQ